MNSTYAVEQLNTHIMTGRLIVVGDSFCLLPGPKDTFKNWCQQAADLLQMPLVVRAERGVSQDWQWEQLRQLMTEITGEDRLLVVLTHCERQWFDEHKPGFTHVNVGDLPEHLGEAKTEAIRQWCLHLQRPELDLQHQMHRLGWLHAQIHIKKLEPAWVLPGFTPHWLVRQIRTTNQEIMDLYGLRDLHCLRFTEQNLNEDVQHQEMTPGESTNSVFQGMDARYNHMLKRNHEILAERVAMAIRQSQPIDLRDPRWQKGVLNPSIWHNEAFLLAEMDHNLLQHRRVVLERHQGTLLDKTWVGSWLKNLK